MSGEITIFSIDNPTGWRSAIKRMTNYDFYHTYSYNVYFSNQDHNPFLFCYKGEDFEIVIPLMLRKIASTSYYDATSVYGYAGPLSSRKETNAESINQFLKALNGFFDQNNVVSVFSRLHPSFKNEKLLSGLGAIEPLGNTVYIDLSGDLDAQRNQYRKGIKSDLSRLTKEEFVIFEDEKKEFIEDFIAMYLENMTRIGAKKEYLFEKEYYEMIFGSPDIAAKLFFVKKNDKRIAGSIFVFTGQLIQYHLSATRNDFLKYSPTKLIIDKLRINYSNLGYKELHLGGGVGSSNDSLFNFKSGFSKHWHTFKVWKYIFNEQAYNSLVQKKSKNQNNNFFPKYRSL